MNAEEEARHEKRHALPPLPDVPLVKVQAGRITAAPDLLNLWVYCVLLFFFS